MADETINIDLLINTAKSTKTLSDIKKSLNDLKKASKSITKDSKDYDKLTQAIAETALKGAEAASNFRDMRKAVKDLKDAMEQLGPEDKQFTKLNQAAGALEFKMKKVSDAIKYTSGTPLHNLSAGFHGLRDSVLNLDFEEVNTALKSMGSQMTALAKGALKNLGDRFKSFGAGIANIGKGLGKALTGDLKGGLESAKNGFKGLGDALKVNPLFLIVSVVTLIISKFDDLKNSGGIVGKIFSGIGDAIGWVIDKLKELSDWLGLTNLKEQKMAEEHLASVKEVGEAEDKAFERRKKISEAEFDLAKSKAKNKKEEIALTKKQAKEEYDQELNHLDFQISSANIQIQAIERIRKATGKLTDEQEKQLEELKNSIKDLNADVTVAIDKYVAKDKDADKELTDYNKEQAKKRTEARKKEMEEAKTGLEEFQSINNKIDEENLNKFDKQRQEINASYTEDKNKLDDLLDKKLISLEQYNATVEKMQSQHDAVLKSIAKEQADEEQKKQDEKDAKRAEGLKKVADLETKLSDSKVSKIAEERSAISDTYMKEKDDLDDALDHGLISIDQYNQDVLKLNKQTSDENIRINKEEQKEKQKAFEEYISKVESMQSSMYDSLNAITELFTGKSKASAEKAFQVQKGLSLANATVAGIEATIKALDAPPGPPFSIPGAVAAAALAAANIAKIAQTQFSPGSSGGGSSSPSISSASAGGNFGPSSAGGTSFAGGGPQGLFGVGGGSLFQGIGNQNNEPGSSGHGSQNQPLKAYVVSQEIEKASNKNAIINRRASL